MTEQEKVEKINSCLAGAKRAGQAIINEAAAIKRVFTEARLNVLVASGLLPGDQVEFYSSVVGLVPLREDRTKNRELPALTATVYKTDANGAIIGNGEDRVIFIAGLVRQDSTVGMLCIMIEPEFLKCASYADFAAAFIAEKYFFPNSDSIGAQINSLSGKSLKPYSFSIS